MHYIYLVYCFDFVILFSFTVCFLKYFSPLCFNFVHLFYRFVIWPQSIGRTVLFMYLVVTTSLSRGRHLLDKYLSAGMLLLHANFRSYIYVAICCKAFVFDSVVVSILIQFEDVKIVSGSFKRLTFSICGDFVVLKEPTKKAIPSQWFLVPADSHAGGDGFALVSCWR